MKQKQKQLSWQNKAILYLSHEQCSPRAVVTSSSAGLSSRESARALRRSSYRACLRTKHWRTTKSTLNGIFHRPLLNAPTPRLIGIKVVSIRIPSFPPNCPEATCKGKERRARKLGAWACVAASREVYSCFVVHCNRRFERKSRREAKAFLNRFKTLKVTQWFCLVNLPLVKYWMKLLCAHTSTIAARSVRIESSNLSLRIRAQSCCYGTATSWLFCDIVIVFSETLCNTTWQSWTYFFSCKDI